MSSRRDFLRGVAGLATIGAGAGVGAALPPGRGNARDADFIVPLTHGGSENPDLEPTGATGFTEFSLNEDGTLDYRITAKNVTNVTQAHIHGPASKKETAGVLATLFAFSANVTGPVEDARDGPIEYSGTVTDTALVANVVANPDQYYVNLHTVRNPAGEIRGQIRRTGRR